MSLSALNTSVQLTILHKPIFQGVSTYRTNFLHRYFYFLAVADLGSTRVHDLVSVLTILVQHLVPELGKRKMLETFSQVIHSAPILIIIKRRVRHNYRPVRILHIPPLSTRLYNAYFAYITLCYFSTLLACYATRYHLQCMVFTFHGTSVVMDATVIARH